MYWYLTNIASQQLSFWQTIPASDTQPFPKTQLVTETVPANTVCNAITYDGISSYTPPTNMQLVSSNNVYTIGSAFNN